MISLNFLFSWAAFLGADVAMRYSRLVGVDMLVKKLPRKLAKVIQIAVFGIIIALLTAFVFYGTSLSIESKDRSFQTLSWLRLFPSLRLPCLFHHF